MAIISLLIFNYLNTRVASVSQVYARASERLVQALLYVESTTGAAPGVQTGTGH